MLDIKYIRENAEAIKAAAKNKNIAVDIDGLLALDDRRRALTGEIDALRARRNDLAKQARGQKPGQEQIAAGRELKDQISGRESELAEVEAEYRSLMVRVPTIPAADTPVGKDDSGNREIFRWGEATKFDFPAKDHVELGRLLDIIDLERGAKVSGYRGYYLKNEGALLQMALMMFAFRRLADMGFTPVVPPTLVKEFVLFGSGYFGAEKYDPDRDEVYRIANEEIEADGQRAKEGKYLVGTAEPSLLAYYANETLDAGRLPIKFCGFSQCYRSEIGSYGKDTKGMYRVHEFMKVEQVAICRADPAEADRLHEEMVAISEGLHRDLGLPYRKLRICTGDMSAGKYKMYDLEAWIPSRQGWGETGSASNFLDWQARRLNVRYKEGAGEARPVYMINNTALASARTIIAILENFQQADGSVRVPEALWPYLPETARVIAPKPAVL